MPVHNLEPVTFMQETSEIIKYCTLPTEFSVDYV